MSGVEIRVRLTSGEACALKRFVEKVGYAEAMAVLYTHVKGVVRQEQASEILEALRHVERALNEANINSWPWIETGGPQ